MFQIRDEIKRAGYQIIDVRVAKWRPQALDRSQYNAFFDFAAKDDAVQWMINSNFSFTNDDGSESAMDLVGYADDLPIDQLEKIRWRVDWSCLLVNDFFNYLIVLLKRFEN
jgi:hypothetical protein